MCWRGDEATGERASPLRPETESHRPLGEGGGAGQRPSSWALKTPCPGFEPPALLRVQSRGGPGVRPAPNPSPSPSRAGAAARPLRAPGKELQPLKTTARDFGPVFLPRGEGEGQQREEAIKRCLNPPHPSLGRKELQEASAGGQHVNKSLFPVLLARLLAKDRAVQVSGARSGSELRYPLRKGSRFLSSWRAGGGGGVGWGMPSAGDTILGTGSAAGTRSRPGPRRGQIPQVLC